jgi:uncharacterized repeat protein (TIGR01451 family)
VVIAPPARRGVQISPTRVIAPVGTQVVLTAGNCGDDGFLKTHEPIEWTMLPGGVGEFVGRTQRNPYHHDWLEGLGHYDGESDKITPISATGRTSKRQLTLTRGTVSPLDDVRVLSGQTWVAVSSDAEGTSYVSAFAPKERIWDRRRAAAQIFWVNAQWQLPPPAVVPAGARHLLTTTVTRQTDHAPTPNWLVRYEITSGPPSGFGPDMAQAVEAPTNAFGQASVELIQTARNPGMTTITIHIIRAVDPATGAPTRLAIGSGSTSVTWGAPALSLDATGPPQTDVGTTAVFGIEVANTSGRAARDVVVTTAVPAGMTFVGSNPQSAADAGGLSWRLGDVAAGESRRIEINCRPERVGAATLCFEMRADGTMTAKQCATTTIVPPRPLAVECTPETSGTVRVGDKVLFRLRIANRGDAALQNVALASRLDAGLEHEAGSSIQRPIGVLAAGETKEIGLTVRVAKTGRLGQAITVSADGGLTATTESHITVDDPQAAFADMKLAIVAPGERQVGETAKVQFEVTNTGRLPLTNVVVKSAYHASLDPSQAQGFERQGADLVWRITRVEPGATARAAVYYDCRTATSDAFVSASATCDEQVVRSERAPVFVMVAHGTPRTGRLKAVVHADQDSARVGDEITYVITVENLGDRPAENVALTITLPERMTYDPAKSRGPSAHRAKGNSIQFNPVLLMRPDEPPLVYRVVARATEKGRAAIKAEVTSSATPAASADAVVQVR